MPTAARTGKIATDAAGREEPDDRPQAMVGLKVDGDVRVAAQALAALDEVDYVVVCAGSFDVIVEIVCEDDEHLPRILNDHVWTIPAVTNTETFVYLRLEKQTYSWGTR